MEFTHRGRKIEVLSDGSVIGEGVDFMRTLEHPTPDTPWTRVRWESRVKLEVGAVLDQLDLEAGKVLLYRYFTKWGHAGPGTFDLDGDLLVPTYEDGSMNGVVAMQVFRPHRATDRCWFIRYDGKERRVLKGDGKRFAHECPADAYKSFLRRCAHRIGHLKRELAKVEAALKMDLKHLPVRDQPGVYMPRDDTRYSA